MANQAWILSHLPISSCVYGPSGPILPWPSSTTSSAGPFRSLPSLNADAPGNVGTIAKSPPVAKAKTSSAAQGLQPLT